MGLIVLSLLRTFRAMKARCLVVACLVATTVTVYAGTFLGISQLSTTTTRLYSDLRLFDLDIHTSPVALGSELDTTALREAAPDVVGATWRYITRGMVELSGDRTATAVIIAVSATERPEVGDVLLSEGEIVSEMHPDEIVIDRTFASEMNVRLGSALTLHVGGKDIPVRVRGIGVHPEFLVTSSNEGSSIPVRGTSMMALVSRSLLKLHNRAEGSGPQSGGVFFNDLVVKFSGSTPRDTIREAIRARLEASNIQAISTTWPDEHYSVRSNKSRLTSYGDFLPTLLAIFVGLNFLVIFLTVRRQVQLSRHEIATLLALGVTPITIVFSWILVVTFVVTLGAAVGTIGVFPLAARITEQYIRTTGFPLVTPRQDYSPILHVWLACHLLIPLAVAAPLTSVLGVAPSQSLREAPDGVPSRFLSLVERLDTAIARYVGVPYPERMGFRNVVRRPSAFLTTWLGASGLLVIASSMHVFADAMEQSMSESTSAHRWDYLVTLAQPTPREQTDRWLGEKGASAWEEVLSAPVRLRARNIEVSSELVAGPIPSKLRPLREVVFGRDVSSEDALEIVLDLNMVAALDIQPGQNIEVILGGTSHQLLVSGVVGEFSANQAFIGRGAFRRLTGEAALVQAAVLTGPPSLEHGLYRSEYVRNVIPGRKLVHAYNEVTSALASLIRFYAYLSAGVGAFLVTVLTITNVLDRSSEHTLLRSLGIPVREILRGVAVEITLLALSVILLTLPLSHLITGIFQRRLMITSGWYLPLRGVGYTYVKISAVVFILMLFSLLPTLLVLRRADDTGRRLWRSLQ